MKKALCAVLALLLLFSVSLSAVSVHAETNDAVDSDVLEDADVITLAAEPEDETAVDLEKEEAPDINDDETFVESEDADLTLGEEADEEALDIIPDEVPDVEEAPDEPEPLAEVLEEESVLEIEIEELVPEVETEEALTEAPEEMESQDETPMIPMNVGIMATPQERPNVLITNFEIKSWDGKPDP
ncbi:MAG TPA: hypothetical protein GXZ89_01330 [Fastidiosipila sp.]|nr:hypothetical protein [Fastidiosipila sp.]